MEEDEKKKKEAESTEPKETDDNKNDGTKTKEESTSSNVIEQAKIENDRREKILVSENALQDRKEKLHAEEMVSGRGQTVPNNKPTEKDKKAYSTSVMNGKIPKDGKE